MDIIPFEVIVSFICYMNHLESKKQRKIIQGPYHESRNSLWPSLT